LAQNSVEVKERSKTAAKIIKIKDLIKSLKNV
jgi:hypothetical protein